MPRRAIVAAILAPAVMCAACAPAAIASRSAPVEVKSFKDVDYYTGRDAHATRHKLDLYLPRGAEHFPVLFFVHGGAWSSGDKGRFTRLGTAFARQGIGVVATNYRLTPEVTHPAHIQDVARAFAWTHKHIADYGGDPKKIFLCGHSAGGHLVALLALDEQYLEAHELTRRAIAGVIPISGVFNIPNGLGPIRRSVFGEDADAHRDASPITYAKKLAPGDEAGLPPFLIIIAQHDPRRLRDDAAGLRDTLDKAGHKPEFLEAARRTHGTIITRLGSRFDRATRELLRFIREHSEQAAPDD